MKADLREKDIEKYRKEHATVDLHKRIMA